MNNKQIIQRNLDEICEYRLEILKLKSKIESIEGRILDLNVQAAVLTDDSEEQIDIKLVFDTKLYLTSYGYSSIDDSLELNWVEKCHGLTMKECSKLGYIISKDWCREDIR